MTHESKIAPPPGFVEYEPFLSEADDRPAESFTCALDDGFDDRRPTAPSAPAWPEIDSSLLEEARGPVPAFPLDVLPPLWRAWVSDTAQSTGTAVDYVAQGLFAAIAAVSGAGVSIQVTQAWSEPMVLWQALVGLPSSGKSPALAAVRRQLSAIENGLQAGDGERRARHTAATAEARLQRESWEERCAAAIARNEPVPDAPLGLTAPPPFAPSQLLVADATVEALADVVAGNPRGVILWRDELAAWLANQNRYAHGGNDRAHWLEAWAGAAVTVNRRNREQPLHLARFPVSIVGSIQPDRIAEAFEGADDGMAARFLYVWPDIPGYRSLWERQLPNDEAALALLQKIAGIVGSAEQPLRLRFAPEAVEKFDRFLRYVHEKNHDADGHEAGWLGKGPGTMARLAAAMTLLHWSESPILEAPQTVEIAQVEQAGALWGKYFRQHARAVFNQAGASGRDRNARRLVKWLKITGTTVLSREAVRREALTYSVDAEGADRVIARLEAGGILRLIPTKTGQKGRPTRRWVVNPGL